MTRYKSRPLAGEGQGCCWALRNKLVASGEKIKTSFQVNLKAPRQLALRTLSI